MFKLASFITAFLFLLCLPLSAHAWEPPADVRIIVAFKAGSGTDTGARLLASFAKKYVGKNIYIASKPGGNGRVGWTELIQSPPDGLTLGFINLATFISMCNSQQALFKVTDIIPVVNYVSETSVIVVKQNSPWKSLNDLVAACRAAPGTYACSTNGVRASNHTAAQLFATSADFTYKAVAYDGTVDQIMALRQGKVDFSCVKAGDVAPLIGGTIPELRVLGVFAAKRLPQLPEVPTLAELGYYPYWYGSDRLLALPAGTPQEIVDFYVEAFRKTMQDPATIAAHNKAGLQLDFMDNVQTAALVKEQEAFFTKVVSKLYK